MLTCRTLHPSIPCVLRTVLSAGLVVHAGACAPSVPAIDTAQVPVPSTREFLTGAWDTVVVHRIARDSVDGFRVNAVYWRHDSIDVADASTGRIMTIAPNGARRWRFVPATGSPTHQKVGAVQMLPDGRTAILSAKDNKLLIVAADGSMLREMALDAKAAPTQVVANADGRFLVFDLRSDSSLKTLAADGTPVGARPLPWPGIDTVSRLARQVWLTQLRNGGWAATFSMGSGIMIANGGGSAILRTRLVEPVNFPTARRRTDKSGTTTGFSSYFGCTACAVAADSQFLYVVVGTVPAERGRLMDRYTLTDGRYAGSIRLPDKADAVAIDGDRVVTVRGTSPSVVTVLRFSALRALPKSPPYAVR